ncbi:MAG: Pvc16 family protein [Bacteroidia bacterium]
MIHHELNFIASSLNEHIKRSLSVTEDVVILSNLVNNDGTAISGTENKLVITVFNLLPETSSKHIGINKTTDVKSNGNLNTYFVISSNFKDYRETLKLISIASDFFHDNNIFSKSDSPDLPGNLNELKVEDVKLDFTDLCSIWGYLGTNYRPSLNYKITVSVME